MYISVKSETDSRPFVYPLMRALFNFGSTLVVSSNRQLNRLVQDSDDGVTFRNITIVVDEFGATDDIYNDYGYAPGDFDYVILDNVGVPSADKTVYLLGSNTDFAYQEEINMLINSDEADKVVVIQLGKPPKQEPTPKEKKGQPVDKGVPEAYDPAQKFRDQVANVDTTKKAKPIVIPFPSFQDIEKVEGEHKFYEVPQALIKPLHDMLGAVLGVDANQFRKEVKKPDERSCYIKRDPAGEN